jgi:hypothetical protein
MTGPNPQLARILRVDALTCTAMGLLLALAAPSIGALTDIPSPLLSRAGMLLLPIAAFMFVTVRMVPVPTWAVRVIVLGNALWVLVSLALPLSGVISPNLLGWFFLTAQAMVVAILAGLELGAKPRAAAA